MYEQTEPLKLACARCNEDLPGCACTRIVNQPPHTVGNPPCVQCSGPTQRTGACFTCLACGSTTSC